MERKDNMSLGKDKRVQIKRYILEKIGENCSEIVGHTVEAFGVTPYTVYRYIRKL